MWQSPHSNHTGGLYLRRMIQQWFSSSWRNSAGSAEGPRRQVRRARIRLSWTMCDGTRPPQPRVADIERKLWRAPCEAGESVSALHGTEEWNDLGWITLRCPHRAHRRARLLCAIVRAPKYLFFFPECTKHFNEKIKNYIWKSKVCSFSTATVKWVNLN